MSGLDVILANLLIVFIYFGGIIAVLLIPAYIAFKRRHPNRWLILVLCLCLGLTGIGWAVALVWALRVAHLPENEHGAVGGESGLNLFANDVKRVVMSSEPDRASLRARPGQQPSIDNVLQQIERLEKLKAAGHIDEVEFARLKAAALATM